MSANVGEDLKPMSKVASGGELARIMLALKNVLAEQDHVPTLIFDEVDAGVSGQAAQKVAEKLCQVARTKQILCVTHLAQLAAMAHTHLYISKAVREGENVYFCDTSGHGGAQTGDCPHHRRRGHYRYDAEKRGRDAAPLTSEIFCGILQTVKCVEGK